MRRAARPRFHALVVLLGLFLAFAVPAAAEPNPAPPQVAAQASELERDADRLADLLVEKRNVFLGQNTPLSEPERRARSAEIDREIEALRAKWRGRARDGDARLAARAEALAAPRHLAEREKYAQNAPPPPPGPSRMDEFRETASYLFSNLLTGLGGILSTILLIAVIAIPLWLLFRFGKAAPPKDLPPLSDNYGTASYAEMRPLMPNIHYALKGVFFGKSSAPELDKVPLAEQPGAPVLSTPEHHTLIVARTRTGKGTRVIVPTLLRYAGSAIVIDPKGENAAVTARVRAGLLAQAVHVINPWGELAATFKARGLAPATFNPLDVLVRDDPNAVAVAQALAGAVCPASPADKDRYWQGSAANVLAAVLLWITDQPGEQKTLARAREIVSLSRKDFTEGFLVKMAASSAFGGAIREMVSPYLDLAQETYSGIMSNLSENTKFLSDPQVKAATATSSFDMADLIRDPVTVYLVIPPDRIDTQRTWLRLMTTAAMHTFKRHPLEGRPPHRCMILMDEFPALGRIEDMPRDIATMSGYGIDFTLIVQGLDQLKDIYGAAAGTILSNCAYKWFCNVNDLESAKYLSDTLGKQTVRTVGRGENQNEGPGGAGKGESVNYGETGRPLLMPDEVLSLGRDVAIVLNPEGRPHYVRPVDYWQIPQAFASLAATYPKLYWEPPLAWDDNPYFVRGNKQGDGARQDGQSKADPPKAASGPMSRKRALSILDLTEGATPAEIIAAHRRLIKKLHPDTGGSNGIAQLLNEARDVLTERAP
ncbi:type IV secretory system conjugative DNA transfer family protein [Rhizorhapis sp. SPR117]|uniref:type IV secretory system conjugative DNA transfer family protein n=1 Tax=Rhizorhapis sp. SPR117 TaxID=2912611 RepID=UPI001F0131B1|nr:type IV secretory system conjugative DNA transfer family protein [Rhizorhapis sp. SPR117]